LSWKKSCSPAVKMNSPPQSTQVRSRSTNSIHFPHGAEKMIRRGGKLEEPQIGQPGSFFFGVGPDRREAANGLPDNGSTSLSQCRCLLDLGRKGAGRAG
jgi:hypothetical protein